MKQKHVYIVLDTEDNLIFSRSAFLSEQDALDYAVKLNNIRLANGMYLINYQIVKLNIEKPLIGHELSEKNKY